MESIKAAAAALETQLNNARALVGAREQRYQGRARLRYVSTDELPADLAALNVNLCSLAVDVIAERLRVTGLAAQVNSRDVSDRANAIWRRSQLDQLIHGLMVDALALGAAYLIVWPDEVGRPRVTCESAHNVVVTYDPLTGAAEYALKRWEGRGLGDTTPRRYLTVFTSRAVVVLEDKGGALNIVSRTPHGLGVVPVVALVNHKRATGVDLTAQVGASVIDDVAPLNDALNKILADMLTASEDTARPRRWATGVDLEEDTDPAGFTADGFSADEAARQEAGQDIVSPFADGNRMFTVENENAKFGQLPGADLKGYQTAVEILLQQIMAVAALPAHMVGVTTSNPSSADAIRAAEAGLTARAESKQLLFGIGIEQAISMALAMEVGFQPKDIDVTISWASAATRSVAQEADAVTKLHTLGIMSTDEARRRLGLEVD